ncbi:MAG: transposase [Planctomycetaceae bacterium]
MPDSGEVHVVCRLGSQRSASSGPTRRQGGITKSGNRHVRRLLIEAAWHYYHARPNASLAPLQREGLPREVIDIADNALRRLRKRSLKLQRIKKSATKIVTALARELAGFLWSAAITTQRLHREQTSHQRLKTGEA